MSDHPPNGNGRRARVVVLLAFAAVLLGQALATAAFITMIAGNRRSDAETACRARIANHAAALRDDRDSAGWDALAASVLERQQIDTFGRAKRIRDLDQALAEASDLRSHAGERCATDPDFVPPP